VPDELQGKSVRCPSCETVFTAQAAGHEGAPPPQRSEPDDFERIRRDPVEPPRERDEPRTGARDRWEDDDDYRDVPRYGRRYRGAAYGEALSAVSGPATALQVTGWLAVAIDILFLGLAVVELGVGAGAAGAGPKNQNAPMNAFIGGAFAIPIRIVGIVLAVLVIMGAGKMKRLESHGWGMASSIIAMIPCTGCCLLGLPFGIWSLVVLNKPEVKDAFRQGM
jgi:hypothetical protein